MSNLKIIFNVFIFCLIATAGVFVSYHAITSNIGYVKAESVDAATAQKAAAQKAAVAASTTKLNSMLSTFASPYGSQVGAVVTDLSNGATASVNGNEQFVSASLYKLFVAYDVYRQIDNGSVSLDDDVDRDGEQTSVSQCLNLMITISDNGCGEGLGALDGWTKLDALLAANGYTQTQLNNYNADGSLKDDKETSANDVALLLTRLYDGTLVSKTSTDAFIALLKAQTVNDRLPTGLPDGTVIAHKTGDLYGYLHDAGIIYSAKKNMLVVLMTGDWDEPQTEGIPLFTTLASDVWTYSQA